jgi:hypothetical protein
LVNIKKKNSFHILQIRQKISNGAAASLAAQFNFNPNQNGLFEKRP